MIANAIRAVVGVALFVIVSLAPWEKPRDDAPAVNSQFAMRGL